MSLAKRIRLLVANVQNNQATRAQLASLNRHVAAHPMALCLLTAKDAKLLDCLRAIRPDMLPR